MRSHWRFQFGRRWLLIAALFLPPVIAFQYRRWRDDYVWNVLETAKQRRDVELVAWRDAHDEFVSGQSASAEKSVSNAQQRCYAARQEVELAVKAIQARYGQSELEVARAMQARWHGK